MSIQPYGGPRRAISRRPQEISRLQRVTELRLARTHAEAIVQTAKLQEIDATAREAITGYAILSRYASAAAAGDPILRDELQIFVTAAQLGAAEMVSHLVDRYCHEGGL